MAEQNSTAGLLNMNEAAKYLGKSPQALRNGYKRWNIPIVRFGGQVQFTKELLDGWIAKNTEQPIPQPKPARKMRDRKQIQPTA